MVEGLLLIWTTFINGVPTFLLSVNGSIHKFQVWKYLPFVDLFGLYLVCHDLICRLHLGNVVCFVAAENPAHDVIDLDLYWIRVNTQPDLDLVNTGLCCYHYCSKQLWQTLAGNE